jgi:hypothetical protein
MIVTILMKERSKFYSFFVAGLFFFDGAYMVSVLPAPIWFNVLDLVVAYFPMMYLAQLLVAKRRKTKI